MAIESLKNKIARMSNILDILKRNYPDDNVRGGRNR